MDENTKEKELDSFQLKEPTIEPEKEKNVSDPKEMPPIPMTDKRSLADDVEKDKQDDASPSQSHKPKKKKLSDEEITVLYNNEPNSEYFSTKSPYLIQDGKESAERRKSKKSAKEKKAKDIIDDKSRKDKKEKCPPKDKVPPGEIKDKVQAKERKSKIPPKERKSKIPPKERKSKTPPKE